MSAAIAAEAGLATLDGWATLDVMMGEEVISTALSLEGSGDEKRISWCRLRPKLSPAALWSERTEVVAALED